MMQLLSQHHNFDDRHRLKRLGLWCLIGVFLLIASSSSIGTSYAQNQTSQTQYNGIDILFIVDQSGSMGGTRYRGDSRYGLGNDRNDFRFFAPQYALRQLTHFLNSLTDTNLPEVRVALLTFGDTTRPLIANWTAVDVRNPNWNNQLNNLVEDISSDRFGAINLGYTDFERAFYQAEQIFSRAPLGGPTDRRLPIIILLTDGAPCVPTPDDPFPNCLALSQNYIDNHINRVNSFVQRSMPNTRVYVMGFDIDNSFWGSVDAKWQEVACSFIGNCDRVKHITSDAELIRQVNLIIVDAFNAISNAIQAQIINIPPGNFDIAPYTQAFTINVYKSVAQPIGDLEFFAPDMQPFSTLTRAGIDDFIETYQANQPLPGTWRIDTARLDISQTDLVLLSADTIKVGATARNTPTTPAMYQPFMMRVDVVAENNITLAVYPNDVYPLSLELLFYDATEIIPQNRQLLARMPMVRDDLNFPGINSFITNTRPQFSGDVEIRINATYDFNGTPQNLISNYPPGILLEIEETTIDWHGLSTTNQRVGSPIDVTVDIFGKDKAPRDMGDLYFERQLLNLDGTPFSTKELVQANQAQTGQYQMSFDPTDAGQYQLQVNLGYLDDAGNFQPLSTRQSPPVYTFTARPIEYLSLTFSLPTETQSDVQAPFPNFWDATSFDLRLEILDANGTPLSLSDLTNGAEALPNLQVTRNGEIYNVSDSLAEIRQGIYFLRTDLPDGEYLFSATVTTPNSQFVGDYQFNNPTASLIHQRTMAGYVLPFILGLLLAVVASVAGLTGTALYLRNRNKEATKNPMKGTMSIFFLEDDYPQILKTVNLTDRGRNTLKLGKNDLPKGFDSLLVTNNAERLEEGQIPVIYVDEFHYEGTRFRPSLVLQRGGYTELHITETRSGEALRYFIGYDIMSNTSSGQSVEGIPTSTGGIFDP